MVRRKGGFTLPLSTREMEKQNHAWNTCCPYKYFTVLQGQYLEFFSIHCCHSREKVYSSFVRQWTNLHICFHRSQHLLTGCDPPFQCLDDTILVILLTFGMLETQHSFQFRSQAGQSWPKESGLPHLTGSTPLHLFTAQHWSLALIKNIFISAWAFQCDDSNNHKRWW